MKNVHILLVENIKKVMKEVKEYIENGLTSRDKRSKIQYAMNKYLAPKNKGDKEKPKSLSISKKKTKQMKIKLLLIQLYQISIKLLILD